MERRLIRSWFLVPAGDEAKLAEGLASGADALVLDLSQTADGEAEQARRVAADLLRADITRDRLLYVAVHASTSHLLAGDIAALVPLNPVGIILPGADGGADIQRLDVMISAQEALAGAPVGNIRIVALNGDHAGAAFSGGTYGKKTSRLEALGWWADRAAGDIGVSNMEASDGRFAGPLEVVRSLTLLGASAAGVGAIDTPSPFDEPDRFKAECRSARGDGFAGKIAVSAEQAAVINAVFAA
jgi:citrate lyase subunit beta/citryl-CoA lyase